MTAQEIMALLPKLGSEQIKKILLRHGAKEPFYGVKIEELKKIQKKVKKNHALALELFATGIGDAQYLAGLIADEKKMTVEDLRQWIKTATWSMVSNYAVAWVAGDSPFGWQLGLEWIDAKEELIASAGWSTLSSLVAVHPDATLDLKGLKKLLARVVKNIASSPDSVKQSMNGFIIAVGSYVVPLTEEALKAGKAIGKLEVGKGETCCNVPYPPDYIKKVKDKGKLGVKRKTARC